MRLEITDTILNAREISQRYKDARKRLTAGPKLRPIPIVPIPPAPTTWTFGLHRYGQNHPIKFDFRPVSIQQILNAVCEFYRVSHTDVISQRRTQVCMVPRQVTMYLAKELTTKSYPQIGFFIGGRDHTTALHGYRKICRAVELDPELAQEIALIREQLGVA